MWRSLTGCCVCVQEAKERPSEELTCLSWMFILSVRRPRGDKHWCGGGKLWNYSCMILILTSLRDTWRNTGEVQGRVDLLETPAPEPTVSSDRPRAESPKVQSVFFSEINKFSGDISQKLIPLIYFKQTHQTFWLVSSAAIRTAGPRDQCCWTTNITSAHQKIHTHTHTHTHTLSLSKSIQSIINMFPARQRHR